MSSNEADVSVLEQIGRNVDCIVELASRDDELRKAVLKFQLEQAADQAVYATEEQERGQGHRLEHMHRVLQRMAVLALTTACTLLQRTRQDAQQRSHSTYATYPGGTSTVIATSRGAPCGCITAQTIPVSVERGGTPSPLAQSSSVEDFTRDEEVWLEHGAHLSHAAVELLSYLLIAQSSLRPALQHYLLQLNLIDYLTAALEVDRQHELHYFQEGYRTEHVRLIANFVFDNHACSVAVMQNATLARHLLNATRIDEENPGMVEWAEFALRNVCAASSEAQAIIRQMRPLEVEKESAAALSRHGVIPEVSTDGKLVLQPPPTSDPDNNSMRSSAYATAEEQSAKIAQWRARGDVSEAKCDALQRKIVNDRESAAREARVQQIAREYRAIVTARAECEEVLHSFEPPLLTCCRTSNNDIVSTLRSTFASLSQQARLATSSGGDTVKESKLQDAMDDVRLRVMRELKAVSARVEHERAAVHAIYERNTDDNVALRARRVRDEAHVALQALHEADESDDTLRRAFDEAVSATESDMLTPLLTQSTSTPISLGSDNSIIQRTALALARAMGRVREEEVLVVGMAEGQSFAHELGARLSLLFPTAAPGVVREIIHTVLARRRLLQKRVAALHDFERAIHFILTSYETALQTRRAAAREQERRQMEHARQDTRCQLLHARLTRERAVHDEHVREVRRREEEARQAADEAAKVAQARSAHEFQARLQALAEYERRKAMQQAQLNELARMREAEAKAALVARQERNAPRVRFRQEQHAAQQAQRRAAEEALREMQERKEAALQRFFDLVEARVGVVADAGRVRRATVASKQSGTYATFAAACQPSLVGYSDEQVMRDPRVRLYHALLEAGLHKTEYGRAVVSEGYRVSPAQRASEENPLRTV